MPSKAVDKQSTAKDTKMDDMRPLDDPTLYINREMSLIRFNYRVLEQALEPSRHPLLERIKFLAIFANNTDEAFMVRISGLRRQVEAEVVEAPPDGMSPADQLSALRQELDPALDEAMDCWKNDLKPKLAEEGINVLAYDQLKGKQRRLMRRYFEREIFPVLTPLAFDPGHPFPHISNLSLNLAVIIKNNHGMQRFARVKIPGFFPRLLRIPEEEKAESFEKLGLDTVVDNNFVWIEDVITANLDLLFPGLNVVAAFPFRITRDADLEIEEDEASDLLASIEESVGRRHFGKVVRLELAKDTPRNVRETLIENLQLPGYLVYQVDGPLGMKDLMTLFGINRPDLKDIPFIPHTSRQLSGGRSIFDAIKKRGNIVLYHPYDSFTPVVDFILEAARDPQVLAIKQTLYRVGPNSPIVAALQLARENGKQVAVLVELKARFDEENNIGWAKALEHAGVHVIYGLVGLKTHAKLCMVVRREQEGMVRYCHLGTGNYNDVTARIYTDIGYFTNDPDIGADVADLFNALTGYASKPTYRKLLVAPQFMREEMIGRIDREIESHRKHGNGYLAFKMNQLVDPKCIQALYRASQAGVKIDLQVRGVCCIRPGVPGISDNIHLTSLVGRFLEHPRIYYFHNNGDEELIMGSADLMPRNLDRRVETLFPVEPPEIKRAVVETILKPHLNDTVLSYEMQADGSYIRVKPEKGEKPLNSQIWMVENRGIWDREAQKKK